MDADIDVHGPTAPSRRLEGRFARAGRQAASSGASKALARCGLDLGGPGGQRRHVGRDRLGCPQLYRSLQLKTLRAL